MIIVGKVILMHLYTIYILNGLLFPQYMYTNHQPTVTSSHSYNNALLMLSVICMVSHGNEHVWLSMGQKGCLSSYMMNALNQYYNVLKYNSPKIHTDDVICQHNEIYIW